MTIWYCIPSANRPMALETLPRWKALGYRVAVQLDPDVKPLPHDICDLQFFRPYKGWAEAVNFLMQDGFEDTDTDTLYATGGDDVLPDPNHQAHEVEDIFWDRFPDGYGVMQPAAPVPTAPEEKKQRGHIWAWSPFIGPEFIRRAYRGEGPMYPGYFHHFADTELAEVAKAQGCWFANEDLMHDHLYFRWAGLPKPSYRRNIRRAHPHDRELYRTRRQRGFPESHPVDGPYLSGSSG